MAEQKESRIEDGNVRCDSVSRMISVLPKYAVSNMVEIIKGKSTIDLM